MIKHMVVLDDSSKASKLTQFVDAFYPNQSYMTLPLDRYPIAPNGSQDQQLQLNEFQSLVKLLSRAEKITFATSFIWGHPSGRLKVFLGRFSQTDKIKEFQLGKKWFGVSINVLALGHELTCSQSADSIFRKFAKHFAMNYQGLFYHSSAVPFTDKRFVESKEIFLNSTSQSA